MEFLKDVGILKPGSKPTANSRMRGSVVARQWQAVGHWLEQAAMFLNVPVETALAVWMVEAGDLPFIRGKPILRFECHKLWDNWGKANPSKFNDHFRFGGHASISGAPWTNHQARLKTGNDWQIFHGNQNAEYQVFELAVELAGMEAACMSASFGGPQILGSNFAALGYANAKELYSAFAESLAAQILGFFDFCRSKDIVHLLKEEDWQQFASVYNGPGQAMAYADHINDAYLEAQAFLNGEPLHPSVVDKKDFDSEKFSSFVSGLNLKHFTPRELLFRGEFHASTEHAAYGLNRFPASSLWPNIAVTARALDTFRAEAKCPMILTSIFRSAEYNFAIGGSPHSQHLSFAAIDFTVRSEKPLAYWADELRKLRSQGLFVGAVGLHGKSIHIDVRMQNVDF
jgi:hypothetical protein